MSAEAHAPAKEPPRQRGRQDQSAVRPADPPADPTAEPPRFLITAAEGFPALEERFLAARGHIRMGFRIFDPSTPLYGPGREVGRDWFDLIVHTLRRGVRIDLALCDFDPVVASELHRGTWRSIRLMLAAAEVAGPDARLEVIAAMHPARVSKVLRVFLYGHIRGELRSRSEWLGGMAGPQRARALEEMPGLAQHLVPSGASFAPRAFVNAGLTPATHHQKIAVFDREWLYVGGLDLDERRWDDWRHDQPAEETWHDVAVVLRGPAAADAHEHLGRFLAEVAGECPPAPTAGRVLRTLSRKRTRPHLKLSPESLVDELAQTYYRAFADAERFVYIESQFFRDRRMARVMAEAARRNPHLTCILIVPAAPEDVAFLGNRGLDARYGEYLQAHCMRRIRRAFGRRLFVGCPAQPRAQASDGRDTYRGAPIIYVHAKVAVFDDARAMVSSANLNGRSLRWDTEAGVAFDEPRHARALRERLFAHWLPEDADPACFAPQTAAMSWARLAASNARAAPSERRGFLLPYSPEPAEAFGADYPAVPEELV